MGRTEAYVWREICSGFASFLAYPARHPPPSPAVTVVHVSEFNTTKINRAIQDCLDRCYSAENPLVAMADCVTELRAQSGWTESEVLQVETTSRRMLKAMLDSSGDNPDSGEDNLAIE